VVGHLADDFFYLRSPDKICSADSQLAGRPSIACSPGVVTIESAAVVAARLLIKISTRCFEVGRPLADLWNSICSKADNFGALGGGGNHATPSR
jgi:hypothetical protein